MLRGLLFRCDEAACACERLVGKTSIPRDIMESKYIFLRQHNLISQKKKKTQALLDTKQNKMDQGHRKYISFHLGDVVTF